MNASLGHAVPERLKYKPSRGYKFKNDTDQLAFYFIFNLNL